MRHIQQRKGDFMKCEECQEAIWDYLDETLSEEDVLQLETHLNGCGDCQAELQDIKHIKGSIQQIQQKELPQDYHANLMKRLEAEQEEANKIVPFGRTKKSKTWLRYSGLVAAALVLFAVGTGEDLLHLKKDLDADVKQQTSQQQETEEISFYMETAPNTEGERFVVEDLNQLSFTMDSVEPTNNVAEDIAVDMEQTIPEPPQFEYLQAPLNMPTIPQSISAGGNASASDMASISNAIPPTMEQSGAEEHLMSVEIGLDSSTQPIQAQEEHLGMPITDYSMEEHEMILNTPTTYHFVPHVEETASDSFVSDSFVSEQPQGNSLSESIESSEYVMPILDTPIPTQASEQETDSMQPRMMMNEIETGIETDFGVVVAEIPANHLEKMDYLVEIDVANIEKACLIVQDYLMEEIPYADVNMIETRKMRVIIEEKDRTQCMKYLLDGLGGIVTQSLLEDTDEEICIDILFHTI